MAKTQISKDVFGPLTPNATEAPAVRITFPDDTVQSLSLEGLSDEVITRLAVHGMSQKLGDSFAGAGKEENPLAFAKARVQAVIEQLKAGEWRVVTGGGGISQLAKAFARATGRTEEECQKVLDDKQAELDNEERKLADNPWLQFRKQLSNQPAVKKALNEIKLEAAKKAAAKDVGEQETDLAELFQ